MLETDGGVSRATFQIAYNGPATADHSMDVQQLGPALLSVGDLCREANAVIYGPDAPNVNVHVRANFEEGCFDITFDLLKAIKEVTDLVKYEEVNDAKELLEWIGLIGAGSVGICGSLWEFLNRHYPDDLQVCGDHPPVPPSRELYSLCSHPMA